MTTAAPREGALTVDHLHWRCHLDVRYRNAEQVRARVEDITRNDLQPALLRSLASIIDDGDESVWFVRHLAIELAADVAAIDERALAEVWAGRVAAAVARIVARGGDGDNVVRFASEADYLASFVTDLTTGRAWDRWWHGEMAGLRALPLSVSIREVLTREPESLAPVLRMLLVARTLETVVAALTPGDARRVLDAAREGMSGTARSAPPHAVRAALERLLPLVRAGDDPDRAALKLAVEGSAMGGEIAPGAPDAAVLAVALVRAVGESGPAALARVLMPSDALPSDGWPGVVGRIAELARNDPAWAARIATTLGVSATHGSTAAQTLLVTPHAGIFLLLPALRDLRVEDAFADGDDSAHEAALCRLLILTKCLGASVAESAWRDPVVALAAGLEALPPVDALRDAERVARWRAMTTRTRLLAGARAALTAAARAPRRFSAEEVAHLSLARHRGLLDDGAIDRTLTIVARAAVRLFTGTLAGFGQSGAPYVARNFLRGAGTVQVTTEGLHVELPHSPLGILLRMAGVHGREVAVHWVPGQRVMLNLPPE